MKKTIRNLLIGIVLILVVFCAIGIVFGPGEEDLAPTEVAQRSEDIGTESTEPVSGSIEEDAPEPPSIPIETETPEPTLTRTSRPSTSTPTSIPPTETPVLGLVEPGTHLVGQDIEPGIYWGMGGPGLMDSCYWARLSDLSGEFDDIVANANASGQFYVEIKDSDVAFETDCELIMLEYAPVPETSNPTNIEPGIYLVGKDIQPGRYRGQAGADIMESCYWARLSNVSGEFDGIISNNNSNGQYFVQVAETDFALETGCALELVQ